MLRGFCPVKALMVLTVRACAGAPICGLFFGRRPSAVVGRVVSVGIDTIQRILFRRTISHVGVKVLKFVPSFTYPNPAGTIVFVGWTPATLQHGTPDCVDRRSRHAMRAAPLIASLQHFFQQTTTTLCQLAAYVYAQYCFNISAITHTFIVGVSISLFGEFDHTQTPRTSVCGQFNKLSLFGHTSNYLHEGCHV